MAALITAGTVAAWWLGFVQAERATLNLTTWDGSVSSLFLIPSVHTNSVMSEIRNPQEYAIDTKVIDNATYHAQSQLDSVPSTREMIIFWLLIIAVVSVFLYVHLTGEIQDPLGEHPPSPESDEEKDYEKLDDENPTKYAITMGILRRDYENRLKEDRAKTTKEIGTLKQQNEEMSNELDYLKPRLRTVEADNDVLEQEIALYVAAHDDILDQVEALESDLANKDEALGEIAFYIAARDDLVDQVKTLESDLDDKDEEFRALDECYTTALHAEIDAKDTAQELEEQLIEVKQQVKKEEDKVKDRETQIKQLEDELISQDSQLKKAEESLKEAEKKVNGSEAKMKKAVDDAADAEKKCKDLEAKLEAAEKKAKDDEKATGNKPIGGGEAPKDTYNGSKIPKPGNNSPIKFNLGPQKPEGTGGKPPASNVPFGANTSFGGDTNPFTKYKTNMFTVKENVGGDGGDGKGKKEGE